jgi:hypothetical protein
VQVFGAHTPFMGDRKSWAEIVPLKGSCVANFSNFPKILAIFLEIFKFAAF